MKYYYANDNHTPIGPVTVEQLHELYRAGKINSNTVILEDGKTQHSDWKPFNHIAASTAVVKNSKRYKNGYTTANQIVKFGDACKLIGLVILIGGILAGFGAFALLSDHSREAIYLQATTYFCLSIAATPVPVWAGLHILGVIICALGEILLATLDTAINTTKHENL